MGFLTEYSRIKKKHTSSFLSLRDAGTLRFLPFLASAWQRSAITSAVSSGNEKQKGFDTLRFLTHIELSY